MLGVSGYNAAGGVGMCVIPVAPGRAVQPCAGVTAHALCAAALCGHHVLLLKGVAAARQGAAAALLLHAFTTSQGLLMEICDVSVNEAQALQHPWSLHLLLCWGLLLSTTTEICLPQHDQESVQSSSTRTQTYVG